MQTREQILVPSQSDPAPQELVSRAWAEGNLGAGAIPPEYLTQSEADALYKALGYVPAWGEITGKPATFPPSAHNHDTLYAPLARQIATGAGLTGGGDLSEDRTLGLRAYAYFDADATGVADKSLPSGTDVYVDYGTENSDQQGWFAAHTFTPQVAGRYLLFAGCRLANVPDQTTVVVKAMKNGVRVGDFATGVQSGTSAMTVSGGIPVFASAGDAFRVAVRVVGDTGTLLANILTYFTGWYVGAS